MNLYELTYLLSPELTGEEAEAKNDEIAEKIKKTGATLYKLEGPKKRNLAYELDGFNEAYIASIDLDVESLKIKVIEEKIKQEEAVLRHLLISKKEVEEEDPSEEKPTERKEESEEGNEEDNEDEEKKSEKEEDEEKKEDKDKKVKLKEIDDKIDEIL